MATSFLAYIKLHLAVKDKFFLFHLNRFPIYGWFDVFKIWTSTGNWLGMANEQIPTGFHDIKKFTHNLVARIIVKINHDIAAKYYLETLFEVKRVHQV